MAAGHASHHAIGRVRAPVAKCSAPRVQPERPAVSASKARTLAVAGVIGWGGGGAAKRDVLATMLGIASARISRAFSPHYRDTLSEEQVARLAAEWPAVRAIKLGVGAPAEAA